MPVDFVPRALDHIAHQPESELSGDTFHLLDPKPISMGETVNELAKAAGAPQLAMRIDANLSNIVPAPVMAGIQSLPTVKAIRAQVLSDLDIPPQVLEHRDFKCDFDTRDAQRALRGSGIAVPPLSSYADPSPSIASSSSTLLPSFGASAPTGDWGRSRRASDRRKPCVTQVWMRTWVNE